MTMQASETDVVRRSVLVGLPVEKAFRLFTEEIDTWWPVASHSIAGDEVETVVVEPREGGRVYERAKDGTEHDWADVVAWEPPNRLTLAWRVSPSSTGTEVDVRFVPEGDGTRVELEHSGWDRDRAAERDGYDSGWEYVLAKLVDAA